MSITQSDTIDGIGICKSSGSVILTISDHLSWQDPDHLQLLQDKLNSYIAFVESGQLETEYNDAIDRKVEIDLVCKFEPDSTARSFLDETEQILRDASIGFKWYQLEK